MMKKEDFIYLIYKEYKGMITAEEKDYLDYWLSASAENRQIKTDILMSMDMLDDYSPEMDIDVENDFAALEEKMHLPEQATTSSKGNPTPKVISIKKWMYAAASVVVLMGAVTLWNTNQVNADQFASLATTGGQTDKLMLDDGSTIWLNENSSVQVKYASEVRHVDLQGEAFFEVTPDADRRFEVQTTQSLTTVLGTSFEVSATPGADQTTVLVRTGKVRFENTDSGQQTDLTAKDKATLDHSSKTISTTEVSNFNELMWQSNRVSFRNTPISQVLEELAGQFDKKIDFENLVTKDCPVTITSQEAEIETILNNLKVSHKIQVKRVGTGYKIGGGEC